MENYKTSEGKVVFTKGTYVGLHDSIGKPTEMFGQPDGKTVENYKNNLYKIKSFATTKPIATTRVANSSRSVESCRKIVFPQYSIA